MSDPFIAEIVMFGGNFAPRSWAFTDGQLLPISQNSALFSLIGAIYGGDARTTMGLPDLRSRNPVHAGRGPGLTPRQLGERGGSQEFTMFASEMPQHSHSMFAERGPASASSPDNAMIASHPDNAFKPFNSGNGEFIMGTQSIGNTGGGQSVQKVSPYSAVNFIISLFGVYPSRS